MIIAELVRLVSTHARLARSSSPTSSIRKKCISYATIELRDERLPIEIAENLEGWFTAATSVRMFVREPF